MMVDRYLGEWFISTCATSVSSIKAQIYALSHYFNFLYDEGFISNLQKNKIKETMKNKDKYILKYMEYLGQLKGAVNKAPLFLKVLPEIN